VLAALATALLLTERNGRVAAWLASLLAGLGAMVIFDRIRGTSLGDPWTCRREWLAPTALAGLSLLLVGHDLTHWHWGGTPDETHFFMTAKAIAEGHYDRFPLSQSGVFDFQPVLSSYYQALFMKVFGVNIFAWRLSSAVALALAVPLLYVVGRELWGRRAGLFAAVFLGCAQLAVGFAHFGYNNTQVYPVVAGSLAAMLWGTRRRSLTGYYLTGWIAGLGCFTYYVALAAVPLVMLLGWSSGRLTWRRGRRHELVVLAVPLLLCALPALTALGGTATRVALLTIGSGETFKPAVGGSPSGFMSASSPAIHIAQHWLLSVVHGLWFRDPHHFQVNPVVDPVSGALATVGFWLGVGATVRRRRDGFLVPGYLIAAFIAGAVTPHYRPPLTRLLVLAPLTALLSALALDQLLRCVLPSRRVAAWMVGAAVLVAAVGWNVQALHESVYKSNHGYGDGTTSELIRLTQQLPADYKIVYVQRPDSFMQDVDSVMIAYELQARFSYLRPTEPRTLELLGTLTPPFFVAYNILDSQQKTAVERALTQRFSDRLWRESAPGKAWSLTYFAVPTVTFVPEDASPP
jgi:hypothetical protein